MTALDTLMSVQFVTVNGRRLAVLSADDWESLVEWLETREDLDIAKEACRAIRAAGGARDQAGWLHWDEVREDLG